MSRTPLRWDYLQTVKSLQVMSTMPSSSRIYKSWFFNDILLGKEEEGKKNPIFFFFVLVFFTFFCLILSICKTQGIKRALTSLLVNGAVTILLTRRCAGVWSERLFLLPSPDFLSSNLTSWLQRPWKHPCLFQVESICLASVRVAFLLWGVKSRNGNGGGSLSHRSPVSAALMSKWPN